MIVEQAMSRLPYSVPPQTSVREALRILIERDIRHLPIVEGSSLIGIVSIRDLPMMAPPGVVCFGAPHEVQQLLDQPVSNVMSTDVISVHANSGLGAAVDLLLAHKIGALPVVETDGRTLVGILSYIDALRCARAALND
jgi:acetoin utilization protein AcuB